MAFLVRMQSDAHSHGSKPSTANHVSITWHCGIRNKSYANDMLAKSRSIARLVPTRTRVLHSKTVQTAHAK